MWDYLNNFLNFNIHKHIPSVSNFCEWKKPVWKCPLDEKIRSLIRKNRDCGIQGAGILRNADCGMQKVVKR